MVARLGKRTIEGYDAAGESIIIHAEGGVETNPHDVIHVKVDLIADASQFSNQPDHDWLELWGQQDYPNDLDEPKIESGAVFFTVAPPDLERAWEALKGRVEATNEQFNATVLPAREASTRKRETEEQARQRQIEEAQRRLDALD
jgi:hypothetical protein